MAPSAASWSGARAIVLILTPSTSTSAGKAGVPLPSHTLAPRKRTGFITSASVRNVRLILSIRHVSTDATRQAGRQPRDHDAIDHGQDEGPERDPWEHIEGPGLAWLDKATQWKQHDHRTGNRQHYMANDLELTAMVPDHVDRKRQIRKHVRKNDRDRAERAGKAEIVHRRDSTEQDKPQNKRNCDDEKHPHRAVWRLVLRMNLAQEFRQQAFATGVEENTRLRVHQPDQRAQDAGDTSAVRHNQQGGRAC